MTGRIQGQRNQKKQGDEGNEKGGPNELLKRGSKQMARKRRMNKCARKKEDKTRVRSVVQGKTTRNR